MDLILQLLYGQAEDILHTKPTEEKSGAIRQLLFAAPTGGSPVQITAEPGQDLQVKLYKTPRYYPADTSGIYRLLGDLKKYSRGETVLLTYINRTGEESRIDRIAPSAETEGLTPEGLIALCGRIRLIHSDALKDLLAAGGYISFHFWDPEKNFRYRQIGRQLIRESLSEKENH